MIKTTMHELRTYKQIAYAAGIYGCNGRLFSTDLGLIAQTGRTPWLYRV